MRPPMNDTAEVITTSVDDFGDRVEGVKTSIVCRVRPITTYNRETNRGEVTSDTMLWTMPDAPIAIDTLILYEGVRYRIKNVIKARDFDTTTVHFLKCVMEVFSNVS